MGLKPKSPAPILHSAFQTGTQAKGLLNYRQKV
jgi:hypothetical protein